jgi:hypothetical protein
MSHITKEYFEGHPAYIELEEAASFLGVDLGVWVFSDAVEVIEDDIEYITAVYTPEHDDLLGKGWSLYAAIICEEGEWKIQQFGMSQE